MSPDPTVTRRALIAVGAAGAGTVVLAACSSAGAGSDAGSPTVSNGSNDDDSGSDSGSASGSDSGSGAGSSNTALATLDDIPVGQAVSVQLPDGKPGIVARPTATTAAAFSAVCTHQGCTVKPKGRRLDCPCHGSVFEATTGEVMQGPAPSPLPSVTVKVAGGKVVMA